MYNYHFNPYLGNTHDLSTDRGKFLCLFSCIRLAYDEGYLDVYERECLLKYLYDSFGYSDEYSFVGDL